MSFERLKGYGSPNADACIELLERFGPWQLSGDDGCRCANISLCGFHISISCHKSEHCIRVYSHHMFHQPSDCVRVSDTIKILLGDEAPGYRIRYCEYDRDHYNGRRDDGKWEEEIKCCYCGSVRMEKDGYLCEKCMLNSDAIQMFPFGMEGSARKCPKCGSRRVERDIFGLSEASKKDIVIDGVKIGFSTGGNIPVPEANIFRCLDCSSSFRERTV